MKLKKCMSLILMAMTLTMLFTGCTSGTTVKSENQKTETEGKYSLDFDKSKYTEKTITVDNKTVKFRAYENIVYVKNPVDAKYESMNIYIPEEYFEDKSIGSYTADNAPIFLPNSVGGYMPGEPGTIGESSSTGTDATKAGAPEGAAPPPGAGGEGVGATGGAPDGGAKAGETALSKGYIVAMPGARGRTTQDENDKYNGKAPAAIVDLKAAVRYLRYNDKTMPGNAEKIISNGTSAGGALSALLGASGNSSDYDPYLKAIGAADTRDDIFASSDYCPITNLENADMAYEWQFNGINDYNTMKISKEGDTITRTQVPGTMTDAQIKLSNELKAAFPAYVNNLGLKDANGNALSLDENGNGSFKNYVKSYVIASAQKALDSGTDLSALTWITIQGKKVTDIDFDKYNAYLKRMKATPAFDNLDLSSAENDEFGTDTINAKHFTKFGKDNSTVSNSTLADSTIVKMMNPMDYIGTEGIKTAPYFRIRYGAADANTSTAIPLILAAKLQNSGYNVDVAIPWGVGHGGDYDLEELFDWMDSISQ